MNKDVFLLLGSNQGRSSQILGSAREAIQSTIGKVDQASSVYRTEAWGKKDQPDFFNQVLQVPTTLAPEELLDSINAIEKDLGRIRRERWGPRLIDIDILFYGNSVIDTPTLKIPHPGVPQRRFTLVPLAEIAPTFIHPVLAKEVRVLLEECGDELQVIRMTSDE